MPKKIDPTDHNFVPGDLIPASPGTSLETDLPTSVIPSDTAVVIPDDNPIEIIGGPISDKIQEALEDTAKTGTAHELRLDKQAYLNENPEAAADPRMQIGQKDVLIINTQKHETISAGELYDMCKANPDCRHAPVFRMACMGLRRNTPVAIRLDQLRELREGKGKIIAG